MVPAIAESREDSGPTMETNGRPARSPSRPFSRKPSSGSAGITHRWFSMRLLGECEERPHQPLAFFVTSSILVIIRRCRIELPTFLIATAFFFSELQLFVVLIGDADGLTHFLHVVLLRRCCTSGDRLFTTAVGILP